VSGPYRHSHPTDPALSVVARPPTGPLDASTSAEGRLTAAVYAASRYPASRLSTLMDTILTPGGHESTTQLKTAAGGQTRGSAAATDAEPTTGTNTRAEHGGPRHQPVRPPA
jgi:hypothetical protein